uniref:Putative oxidoreductase yoxD n=1 Tax=Lygus hesperus TaxID=30085 RepID=A0A0A9WW30_LYGHE
MHRISAVCTSQAITLLLHWIMVEYSSNILLNAILMTPSFVFLLGCSVFMMVYDFIPTFILNAYEDKFQFCLQLFSSFLFLNICLYGVWHNVEIFLHFMLPRMVDDMISLSTEGKWYGLVKIDERIWTTNAALMLSFAVLALVSSKIHRVEKRFIGIKSCTCIHQNSS